MQVDLTSAVEETVKRISMIRTLLPKEEVVLAAPTAECTNSVLTIPVVVLVHRPARRGVELGRVHQVGPYETDVLDDLLLTRIVP